MDWPLVVGTVVAAATVSLLAWRREPVLAGMSKAAAYMRDVRAELHKVTWASWNDLKNMTIVIVVLVGICGIVIGLMDWIFAKLLIDLLGKVFG